MESAAGGSPKVAMDGKFMFMSPSPFCFVWRIITEIYRGAQNDSTAYAYAKGSSTAAAAKEEARVEAEAEAEAEAARREAKMAKMAEKRARAEAAVRREP